MQSPSPAPIKVFTLFCLAQSPMQPPSPPPPGGLPYKKEACLSYLLRVEKADLVPLRVFSLKRSHGNFRTTFYGVEWENVSVRQRNSLASYACATGWLSERAHSNLKNYRVFSFGLFSRERFTMVTAFRGFVTKP